MVKISESTKSIKIKEITQSWHLIDVSGKILGRIIPQIAKLLQGKHKVNYSNNLDSGDNVVVINARKVVITGKKSETKEYTYYSGYPGGLRTEKYKDIMIRKPTEIIRHAVTGMLPKNKLRSRRMTRLHIYADNIHPFSDKLEISK
jgi:large subunit ribosomal protein L13